jgi:hypothetical protein
VAEEIRDGVTDELDYRLKAADQQRFRNAYEGHPFIHILAVYPQLSTGRVLVTDYVRGQRWSLATSAPAGIRASWGEASLPVRVCQPVPPRPVQRRPAPRELPLPLRRHGDFLDFGCVQEYSVERVTVTSALLGATLAPSASGVASALTRLGLLTGNDDTALDHQRLLDFYRALLADRASPQPFTYTPQWAGEVVAHTYQPLGPRYDVTWRLRMPKELLFLNRILIGASSVLGQLYATADWKAIDHEIRHAGPPATSLGRSEAAWRGRQASPVHPASIE